MRFQISLREKVILHGAKYVKFKAAFFRTYHVKYFLRMTTSPHKERRYTHDSICSRDAKRNDSGGGADTDRSDWSLRIAQGQYQIAGVGREAAGRDDLRPGAGTTAQ